MHLYCKPLKTATSRYEPPLDTLQLTGISTTDGISQSNFAF